MELSEPGQDLSSQSDILKCHWGDLWLFFPFFPPHCATCTNKFRYAAEKATGMCFWGNEALGCEEDLCRSEAGGEAGPSCQPGDHWGARAGWAGDAGEGRLEWWRRQDRGWWRGQDRECWSSWAGDTGEGRIGNAGEGRTRDARAGWAGDAGAAGRGMLKKAGQGMLEQLDRGC